MATKPRVLPSGRYRALPVCVLSLAPAVFIALAALPASASDRPRRIFFLESLTPTQQAALLTMEAFAARWKEKSSEDLEIYVDYLELGRFPGQAHEERAARFLAGKYAQVPPDLLIPLGRGATQFVLHYRGMLGPDIPVVFTSVPARSLAAMSLPRDFTGVVTEYNLAKTLALAQRLQPDARNLVMVAGASAYDRPWADDGRRELEPYADRYNIRYLIGLPYDELLREVSHLSRDTIVLMLYVFADGTGRPRAPPEVAAEVAEKSAAPVYSPISTFFGRGIVGGYMDTFEAHGTAAADLAIEILSGKPLGSIPQQTEAAHVYRVDARQLARWRLPDSALPAGTIAAFNEPTIWEQHRNEVLAAIGAFSVQTLVVIIVLIQMRKRQRAERSLQESEDRMAFAAASTGTGIWQLDIVADRLWTTDHCRSMLGLADGAPPTMAALIGAVHPDDRPALADAIRAAMNVGMPIDGEFRVLAPDGATRWFVTRGQPRCDEHGKPVRISGIFADVTARKNAESEADLQRQELTHLLRVSVLGELSGAIAHELNQPLTAILANAQAARLMVGDKNPDLGAVSEVLDDIMLEDNRAGEVISRLRGLLRKGESKTAPIDINDLIQSTLRLLHSELIARKIRVDLALSDRLPPAWGDAVQLQQVLLNLVMNAMDSMNASVPSRRLITIATRAGSDARLKVDIADCGRGIDVAASGRLFQPFFTTKEHGLGLGLSICATIVKAHGGDLALDNNGEGGATASLTLPAHAALVAAQ